MGRIFVGAIGLCTCISGLVGMFIQTRIEVELLQPVGVTGALLFGCGIGIFIALIAVTLLGDE